MSKINILYIHSGSGLYGADIVLWQLIKGIDKSKFKPLVILPQSGPLADKIEEVGVPVKIMKMGVLRRKFFNLKGIVPYFFLLAISVIRLMTIIKKEKIKIVYSNTSAVLAGAIAAWISRTAHIWHIHEVIVKPKYLWKILSGIIFLLSDKVIAISEAVKSHLAEGFKRNAKKAVLIYDGINIAKFDTRIKGEKIRREFNISQDAIIIGMVGRISRWKGQEHFLEGAAEIHKNFPETKFLIVGNPYPGEEYRMKKLQNQIESIGLKGHTFLTGFRSDIIEVLASFDIFILPSQWPEPFGLVILEAMAMEKPVVATNHGGPRDIVLDGITGYLVPPQDISQMVSALTKLIEEKDLRISMGKNGRKRAAQTFTLERQMSALNKIYENVLRDRNLFT